MRLSLRTRCENHHAHLVLLRAAYKGPRFSSKFRLAHLTFIARNCRFLVFPSLYCLRFSALLFAVLALLVSSLLCTSLLCTYLLLTSLCRLSSLPQLSSWPRLSSLPRFASLPLFLTHRARLQQSILSYIN